MSKMIQVRYVEDSLHRRLKSRAAAEGLSLSDFLKRELERIADRPTVTQVRERLAALPTVVLPIAAADLVRAEREARAESLPVPFAE
jgi:plasmid stability protein